MLHNLSIKKTRKSKNLITEKELRRDTAGIQIGFWERRPTIQGTQHLFMIVRDDARRAGYVLVDAHNIITIAHTDTLAEMVAIYNEHVTQAELHDIVLIQQPHPDHVLVATR